jgi:hypothetical protein
MVFLGVPVGGRSGLARAVGRAWDRAADLELSGLWPVVAQITDAAAGPGLYGAPASPAQLRTARRAVTLHPWFGMEQLNHSGLITITGTLGGGKSNLAGLLIYMATRAGIATVVMDPSGLLDRLCAIPEIAAASLAVNLLESPSGTLTPTG